MRRTERELESPMRDRNYWLALVLGGAAFILAVTAGIATAYMLGERNAWREALAVYARTGE